MVEQNCLQSCGKGQDQALSQSRRVCASAFSLIYTSGSSGLWGVTGAILDSSSNVKEDNLDRI